MKDIILNFPLTFECQIRLMNFFSMQFFSHFFFTFLLLKRNEILFFQSISFNWPQYLNRRHFFIENIKTLKITKQEVLQLRFNIKFNLTFNVVAEKHEIDYFLFNYWSLHFDDCNRRKTNWNIIHYITTYKLQSNLITLFQM